MKKKWSGVVLGAWIFSSLLLFNNTVRAVGNDELKIGIYQEFETLNPTLAGTAAAKYMIYFAYRPLIILDNDNQFKPLIVKKIPSLKDKTLKIITENNTKKLIAEWEFVDGFKWSDGILVSCKDLKFAWEIGLNTNVSLPSRTSYEEIESITWDDKTPAKCSVKYNVAKWNFFLNTPDPMPAHLDEEVFKKYGKEREGYDRNTWYQKDPLKKGLWNGPYVVSESKLGSHLVLTPNEHFYGKKPKIKKIIIRILPNSGTLEANLRSKNIDKISRLGFSLDQALAFEKKIQEEKLPYEVKYQDGVTYAHIDVNLSHPILKDVKVRKALSYGLNKKEIIDSVFEGKATVAHHLTSPIDRLYTDDKSKVTIYESDKRKAKKLLDEAGWKIGDDGFRYKEGKKLTFVLAAAGGAKVNETIQAIIQSQWKAIGVDLQIKSETARFLFTESLPKRKFEMALFAWSSFPEQTPDSVLASKNIPTEKNTWTGQNYTGYSNPKVDELIAGYEYEFDFEKRKKSMQEVLKYYTDDIPVIPVYFRGENATIPKGLKGYKLTGHLFYESLKAEDWGF